MQQATVAGVPLPASLTPPDYPRELEQPLRLADGRVMAVRALVPADQPALKASLQQADPQTLYQRFFTTQPHLDGKTLSRLTHLDYRRRLALIAIALPNWPVAVARYEAEGSGERAEVSFLVHPAWRGVGLGSRLARLLEAAARARGVRQLSAYYLDGNERVARLFEHWGFGPPRVSGGVAEVEKLLV